MKTEANVAWRAVCRTELCSRSGRLLRTFNFERDCKGGPHEVFPRPCQDSGTIGSPHSSSSGA